MIICSGDCERHLSFDSFASTFGQATCRYRNWILAKGTARTVDKSTPVFSVLKLIHMMPRTLRNAHDVRFLFFLGYVTM